MTDQATTPQQDAEARMRAALEGEAEIADRAKAIRGDATKLTAAMLLQLLPLLREPIPAAFIISTPGTTGKPYPSTGIRSIQVQIDRLNAVLTPLWWWDVISYAEDGKLATVTICIGNYNGAEPGPDGMPRHEVMVARSVTGGVNQGSTKGNIYKGSYTNAAKRAVAAIGCGHEIYVGAADLDPDVNPDIAAASTTGASMDPVTIGKKRAGELVDAAWEVPAAKSQLQLAATHVAGRDVGACDTKAHAKDALATLTPGDAEKVATWIDGKAHQAADEAAAAEESRKTDD